MALSTSYSRNSKPLGQRMKYHYSVLYNYYEGQLSGRSEDHILSFKFFKDLEKMLSKEGYDQVMSHDKALPGSNILDNLFIMGNESEKIVVLLTPEYLHDGWHKYSEQATTINLLDKHQAHKIVPIAINIRKENIPNNLGLSVSTIIFTSYENDKADDGFWDKLLRAFGPTELHYEQNGYNESCNPTSMVPPVNIEIPNDLQVDGLCPAGGTADGDGQSANSNSVSRSDDADTPRSEGPSNSTPQIWYRRFSSWWWEKMEYVF